MKTIVIIAVLAGIALVSFDALYKKNMAEDCLNESGIYENYIKEGCFDEEYTKKETEKFLKNKDEKTDNADGAEIPIVMYHNISNKSNLLGKYTISQKQFEADLKYLKEHGYETITMSELIDHNYNKTPLPEKPVIITFDDGFESFYAFAFPLLKDYNMKAVVSIVGAYTDMYSEIDDHNVDYSHLTWEEVNEMSDSGLVEIQNHTYNMHEITKDRKGCGIKKGESVASYEKELNDDIGKLQNEILLYTGKPSNTFTYPYGHISPESGDIIKKMGFKAALTCYEIVNKEEEGDDWLYRLGRFNRENGKSSSEFFKKMKIE